MYYPGRQSSLHIFGREEHYLHPSLNPRVNHAGNYGLIQQSPRLCGVL